MEKAHDNNAQWVALCQQAEPTRHHLCALLSPQHNYYLPTSIRRGGSCSSQRKQQFEDNTQNNHEQWSGVKTVAHNILPPHTTLPQRPNNPPSPSPPTNEHTKPNSPTVLDLILHGQEIVAIKKVRYGPKTLLWCIQYRNRDGLLLSIL